MPKSVGSRFSKVGSQKSVNWKIDAKYPKECVRLIVSHLFITSSTAMANANTELLSAVNANKLEAVRAMLRKPGVDVNQHNCLHWAVTFGKEEMSRLLVEAGADLNALGMAGKETPLIISLSHSHPKIALYLLKHGADPNIPSGGSGKYPLEYASTDEVIEALLNHGAKVNVLNKSGQNLLFEALRFPTKLKKLLKAGSDVNLVDKDGYTPLVMAVEAGWVDAVKLLLQFGADIEICGPSGRSVHEIAITPQLKTILENHRGGYNAKMASAPVAPAMVISSEEKEGASVPKRKSLFRSIFGSRPTVETTIPYVVEKESYSNEDSLTVAAVTKTREAVTGTRSAPADEVVTASVVFGASNDSSDRNVPVNAMVVSQAQSTFNDEPRLAALEARVKELERVVQKQETIIAALLKAMQGDNGNTALLK